MSGESSVHVSRNRLEGSLSEANLTTILDACKRHLFTGAIRVTAPEGNGTLVLRAGFVDEARWGELRGEAAVEKMRPLHDGTYELAQRLPDLSGVLGKAAQIEGEISNVPLPQLMRHVEDNALSCTITVVGGFDRGEITYRAGEIAEVSLNGARDDDAIVKIVAWKDAKFRVTAAPLPAEMAGWPKVSREPTAPFKLEGRTKIPDGGAAEVVPVRDKEKEKPAAASSSEAVTVKEKPTTTTTTTTSTTTTATTTTTGAGGGMGTVVAIVLFAGVVIVGLYLLLVSM